MDKGGGMDKGGDGQGGGGGVSWQRIPVPKIEKQNFAPSGLPRIRGSKDCPNCAARHTRLRRPRHCQQSLRLQPTLGCCSPGSPPPGEPGGRHNRSRQHLRPQGARARLQLPAPYGRRCGGRVHRGGRGRGGRGQTLRLGGSGGGGGRGRAMRRRPRARAPHNPRLQPQRVQAGGSGGHQHKHKSERRAGEPWGREGGAAGPRGRLGSEEGLQLGRGGVGSGAQHEGLHRTGARGREGEPRNGRARRAWPAATCHTT